MKTIFKCFIRTISAIHIGCDEVYEPMGFAVDETAKQLIVFDPITFYGQMKKEEKQKFSQICLKGKISSILEVYKFLREKQKQAQGRRIDLCSGFLEHYKKTLSISVKDEKKIQQELNHFAIERTSFNPYDNRPYIPGSSVKGAIRTAYLNAMQQEYPLSPLKAKDKKEEKGLAKKLEGKLLSYDPSKITTDPFRLVKVSDFMPIGEVKTKIVYAVNQKKKPSKHNDSKDNPYQILEVIEPGTIFQGEIIVEEPEKESNINSCISYDKLLKSINQFYVKEKNREDGELKEMGIFSVPNPQGNYLLRIGRHSGAKVITIEGHRKIKIKGKEEPFDYATTLWAASEIKKPENKENLKPFGWVELSELSDDHTEKFKSLEQAWKDKAESEIRNQVQGKAENVKKQAVAQRHLSALEKILKELEVINFGDMGPIGTIVQKIESLETDADKADLAKAIKDKMTPKQFKDHKKKAYLQGLIEKGNL